MALTSAMAPGADVFGAAARPTKTSGVPPRPVGPPPAARIRSRSAAGRTQCGERSSQRQAPVRRQIACQQPRVEVPVEDNLMMDWGAVFVRDLLDDAVEEAVDELVRDIEFESVDSEPKTPTAAEERATQVGSNENEQQFENRMKGQILQALLGGSRNGCLDKALACVTAERKAKAAQESAPAPPPKKEASPMTLRNMVIKTLIDGSRSGQLSQTLSSVSAARKEAAPTTLRNSVMKALIDGSKSGQLSQALNSVCPRGARKEAESDEGASTVAETVESCDDIEGVAGTSWSLNAAAEFTEQALGAATHRLQPLAEVASSSCGANASTVAGSMFVNVDECESVASADMEAEFSPVAKIGHLLQPPDDRFDDGEWDDVLSISSESDADLGEREAAKEALLTMQSAFNVVSGAVESGLEDEFGEKDAESVDGDTADAEEEVAFDYICDVVDGGICSTIDKATEDEEQHDELKIDALTLQACSRRPFGRLLRPRLEQPKAYIAQKPWARGLLSQPVLFAPPPMQEVDWSTMHLAAKSSTAAPAAPAPAEMLQKEYKESEEEMLDSLLESLTTKAKSRPASAKAPTPRDGAEAAGETFESLLASLSDIGEATPKTCKQTPSLNLAPTAPAEPPADAAAQSPPATSRSMQKSRSSKRWVIGGVVRGPASEAAGSHALRGSGFPAQRATAFRMDAEDEPTASPSARESSLTRGYEALGRTEIHSMDVQDNFSTSLSNAKFSAFMAATQAPGQRPMSRSRGKTTLGPVSSPLRAAGASALALDLGDEAAPPPSRFTGLGHGAGARVPPSPAGSPQNWRSASLGALRVTKAAPSDAAAAANDANRKMLPSLPGYSAGSFAWSTARNRRQASVAGF